MSGLQRILVQGDGIVGLAAAIALRRSLPTANIMVAASAETPFGPCDHIGAATPFIHHFHRQIGLDRALFERRTGARNVLSGSMQGAGLGDSVSAMVPAHDIPFVDGVALHQLWLRYRNTQSAKAYSWADMALRSLPREESIGVRFDRSAYRNLLAEMAQSLGIERLASGAEAADNADLIVECLAPADGDSAAWEIVAGQAIETELDNIPSGDDETLILSAEAAEWRTESWTARYRRGDKGALAKFRRDCWTGKILALGDAALDTQTMDGRSLSVAFESILRALEFLPHDGVSPRGSAEYGRRSTLIHRYMLDWAAARWMAEPPAGLQAILEQFDERGRIPYRDEDPVSGGEWLAWLLATARTPRRIDPTALAVSDANMVQIVEAIASNGRRGMA